MCIMLYVKLMQFSGFPEISAQLEGAICLWYMCILLYVKLICCSGFLEIYALLEGVLLPSVYVYAAIHETKLV